MNKLYTVKDINDDSPIANVKIEFQLNEKYTFSNNDGLFDFGAINNNYKINFKENHLIVDHLNNLEVTVYDVAGRQIYDHIFLSNNSGISTDGFPLIEQGLYYLKVKNELSEKTHPVFFPLLNNINNALSFPNEKVIFTKEGYYDRVFDFETLLAELSKQGHISLLKKSYTLPVSHLYQLINVESFDLLKGKPFNQTLTDVSSVKLLFDLQTKSIIYFNSGLFLTHFDFASTHLNYKNTKQVFNNKEYSYNSLRQYIPATLNYYKNLDKYVLEFSSFCEVSCDDAIKIWTLTLATSFIAIEKLAVLKSNDYLDNCPISIIGSEALYGSQNYQPLNLAETYGFLKKIKIDSIKNTYLNWQDVVLVDGIPADLSVVAGLITTTFQTPLSHVNVLSHNRNTPNMALKSGFVNSKIQALVNKLVYLNVRLDSFEIREATITEAEAFWNKKLPKTITHLSYDSITSGLIELGDKGYSDVGLIGGKASNFAELMKIKVGDTLAIPLPEHGFAIPFYYYINHIKTNGIDQFVNEMLADSMFYKDPKLKENYLALLQTKIKQAPIDLTLLNLVKAKIMAGDPISSYRFRSSTNAEDIEGFNGAGLYDSYTGHLTLKDKEIDKAIKKTWASLWNLRAFDERAFFRIDQKSVAMAVLVHRSFPDEYANGVVVTHNPYNKYNDAILINVQAGENSVVRPDEQYLPDQILYYDYKISQEAYEYISHTTLPGFEGSNVMTADELKELQQYCLAIKNHYCTINPPCKVMDIEFKIDNVNGTHKIYIKQARYY